MFERLGWKRRALLAGWSGRGRAAAVAVAIAVVLVALGGSAHRAAAVDLVPTSVVVAVPGSAVAGGSAQSITATLTVAGTGDPVVGQAVTLDGGSGASPASCSALTDAQGQVSCGVTWATAGTSAVTANFAGTAGLQASTDTDSVLVDFAQTALQSSSVSPSPATTTVPVTLSTTFTRTSAPTGPIAGTTVTFTLKTPTDFALASCTGTTDATGHASCSLTPSGPAVGASTVTVSAFGTSALAAPTAVDLPLQVNAIGVAALAASAFNGAVGVQQTITATLTDQTVGTPLVAKQVAFALPGGDTCDSPTVTDSNGKATCTVTPGAVIDSQYTVSYAGQAGVFLPTFTTAAYKVGTASDSTPPIVTVPANMTVEATSDSGAVVTFTVTATDETDGDVTASVVCAPASDSTFALGTTTVNCSATDTATNVGNESFTVTVQDTTAPAAPVLIGPANGSEASSRPTFAWGSSPGTDSYGLQVDSSGCDFDAGLVIDNPHLATTSFTPGAPGFADGTYCWRVEARDRAGNSSLSAAFTFVVSAPVFVAPASQVVEAASPAGVDAVVSYVTPTATDADDPPPAVHCLPASGSTFALGVTTVSCSSTNSRQNTTVHTFTVTVQDTTAPAAPLLTLPANGSEASSRPTFAWGSSPGTDSYGLQVDSSGCDFDAGLVIDNPHLATTSFTPGAPGFADGTYCWRVEARDRAGNSSLSAPFTFTVDTSAPTVTNVTSTTPNGTYGVGETVVVRVGFSEPVLVTGTPQLALNTSATVNYTSGSGTNTLTFTYTVGAGQNSADLDYTTATSLTLNGGTIKDAAANNANLALPAPGAAGSLGANKDIVIDTTAPTVTCRPTSTFLLGSIGNQVSATVTDPGGSGAVNSPVQAAAPATNAGAHSASVTGTDKAGNTTTVSCPYVVGYKFGGFISPLPKSSVNSGSNLPIKFQLQNAAGQPISDTEAQSLVTGTCKIAIILVKPAAAVSGCPTYSTTLKQFQFNLKTTNAMMGGPPNGVSITVTIGGTIVTTTAVDSFTVK